MPEVSAIGVVAVLAAVIGAPEGPEPSDGPWVRLVRSEAAVDAPRNERWDRVRLRLEVENGLPVAIVDLQLEISLVSIPDGGVAQAIPGWRLEESFPGDLLAAEDTSEIVLDRPLAAQRATLPAEAIAYRPGIRGYRLAEPSLELAVRLLQSTEPADQRAALRSYARGPGTPEDGHREVRVLAEVKDFLARPPTAPEVTDAARLLLVLRAAGLLGDGQLVPALVSLPERLPARPWGQAVLELAARMVEASSRDEPRLGLLPEWSRSSFDHSHRREAVVAELVREALLRIGDPAVPALVRAARRGSAGARALATGVLHALGRSTARTQLSLGDRRLQLEVVRALGEVGGADAVAALAELLSTRDRWVRKSALAALERIGPEAIEPLIAALSVPDVETRRATVQALVGVGRADPRGLATAARRYGLTPQAGEGPEALVGRLAEHLAAAARARWAGELERGLELARQGRSDEAFRLLDRVYAADPLLYMGAAGPISEAYARRARDLLGRGNYDAAAETARIGRSVAASREADELIELAQLELARGYLALGALDRAEAALDAIPGDPLGAEVPALRAQVLLERAELAFRSGDEGRARMLVDRARGLAPDDPRVDRLHLRVLIRENLVILIVFGFVVPAGLIALAVLVRRRLEAARLHRFDPAIRG